MALHGGKMPCRVVLFRICWVTSDIISGKVINKIPRKLHRKPIPLPKQAFDKNHKKT